MHKVSLKFDHRFVCLGKSLVYKGLTPLMISGIPWGSWNIATVDKQDNCELFSEQAVSVSSIDSVNVDLWSASF